MNVAYSLYYLEPCYSVPNNIRPLSLPRRCMQSEKALLKGGNCYHTLLIRFI